VRFLISLILIINIYAKVIDQIEILVNNIPITSYDIQKTQSTLGIDKNQAISYLIDKAVLQSAIKQRGIYVDDFDIDKAMEKIAKRNGMSLYNFKNYLLQNGELTSLKKKIKENLEKEKLISSLNIKVTKEAVKKYYENNKDKFMLPSKIDATEYSSLDKQLLQEAINNPLLNNNTNVSIKDISFDLNKTNPKLMQFLAKTPTDTFTPIINTGSKYVSFYIIKKYPNAPLPFDMVAGDIYQTLINQQKSQTIKDFISKLRAKADIKFLTK
jgi:parvulin-like peptidyl-prolyl isomerase